MRRAQTVNLSDGLQMLSDTFAPYRKIADDDTIVIGGADVRNLLKVIRTLRHLAILQEREIGALRHLEAARELRQVVTSELKAVAETLPGDNVVRPDFGGKS